MKKFRPGWDAIWLKFAHLISERSYDDRYKVGAIVVSIDNTQVLAVGYNGNYSGGPNEADSAEPGKSGFIHAEINALLKCDYNYHKVKKLYVTLSPCMMCAKAIINAGISEVIYDDEYRDTAGIQLMKDTGIVVRRVNNYS